MLDGMKTTAEVDLGYLAAIPALAGASQSELEALYERSTELRVRAGRALCRAGSPARQVVILLEGHATADGGQDAGQLGPGAVVGGAEMLGGRTHASTIVTRTVALVLVVSAVEFACLRTDAPTLTLRLAGVTPAVQPPMTPRVSLGRVGLGVIGVRTA